MKITGSKAIQFIVSITILGILLYNLSITNFKQLSFTLSWQTVLPALITLFISLFLRSWRFRYLMNLEQNDIKLGHFDSFKIMLTGSALNVVMPSGMGDIAKSYVAYKWSGVKERMLSVSIFDKMIAFTSLGILGFIAAIITGSLWFLSAIIISIVPIAIIFLIEKYPSNKIIQFISSKLTKINTHEVIRHFSFSKKVTTIALFVSVLSWLFSYFILYFAFQMTNTPISFGWCVAIAPLLTIGRIFPFTFNGVGTDEAIFIYLFSSFFMVTNASAESLLVVALIYRAFIHTLPAALGLISIISTRKMKIQST